MTVNDINSCSAHKAKDRPSNDYTVHEWPEPRRMLKKLRDAIYRRKTDMYTITHEEVNLCLRAHMADPNHHVDAKPPPTPNRTVYDSTLFYDNKDIPVLLFVKNGLQGLWTRTNRPRLVTVGQDAIDYNDIYNTPPPLRNKDMTRHPKDDYAEAKKKWDLLGKPVGVFHYALWAATGNKPGSRQKIPTQYNQYLSADCYGSPQAASRQEKVMQFFRSIAPIMQSLAAWFRALDPEQYEAYRAHFQHLVDVTPLKILEVSNSQCWLGLAVLRNLQVHNHKDKGDVKDGWVAMTCFGDFTEGGELCLPQLDLKLHFRPRDVVFFRSSVLEHFVTKANGQRSSFVFFSHSCAETLKQPKNA
jgi:hypothetical protein